MRFIPPRRASVDCRVVEHFALAPCCSVSILVSSARQCSGLRRRAPEIMPSSQGRNSCTVDTRMNLLARQLAAPLSAKTHWHNGSVCRCASISFEGVSAGPTDSAAQVISRRRRARRDRENVAASLRQLFATGLFDSIEVAGTAARATGSPWSSAAIRACSSALSTVEGARAQP